MMNETSAKVTDRILGSIVGFFIGHALGVGVHWQYDLDKLHSERGYVTSYVDPLPGTFHHGKLAAGQLEQQGAIAYLFLQSLAEQERWDQDDLHARVEREILRHPSMDGTRHGGQFGWTEKSICDLYRQRVVQGKEWKDCISPRSDTCDALSRSALLAALYHATPRRMCLCIRRHVEAQTSDSSVASHAVAFGCLLAGALHGHDLDADLSKKLYEQAGGLVLPFSSVRSDRDYDDEYGHYAEPDSLLWFGQIVDGTRHLHHAALSPRLPPHRGVELYGKFCAYFAVLPSAYYCVATYPDDFERAVLCSVNGGGQNTVRTSLVGALLGARVGLSGIPKRFIDGLERSEQILDWAQRLAQRSLYFSQHHEGDIWQWPTEEQTDHTLNKWD